MKTLFLLRHAKSSWKDETLADFERPLNSRGKRTTKTLGALFIKEKVKPELILSSCAVRARETIEPILSLTKLRSELRFDERIYEASAERLFDVITQIEKTIRSVLIVGHNPGLEELLASLTGQSETMSTGALAKITLENSNWNSIEAQAGTLEWLVKPKDLEKS
jgi:phosphohistidine phosphatase